MDRFAVIVIPIVEIYSCGLVDMSLFMMVHCSYVYCMICWWFKRCFFFQHRLIRYFKNPYHVTDILLTVHLAVHILFQHTNLMSRAIFGSDWYLCNVCVVLHFIDIWFFKLVPVRCVVVNLCALTRRRSMHSLCARRTSFAPCKRTWLVLLSNSAFNHWVLPVLLLTVKLTHVYRSTHSFSVYLRLQLISTVAGLLRSSVGLRLLLLCEYLIQV